MCKTLVYAGGFSSLEVIACETTLTTIHVLNKSMEDRKVESSSYNFLVRIDWETMEADKDIYEDAGLPETGEGLFQHAPAVTSQSLAPETDRGLLVSAPQNLYGLSDTLQKQKFFSCFNRCFNEVSARK
jgi:hypothetical protein